MFAQTLQSLLGALLSRTCCGSSRSEPSGTRPSTKASKPSETSGPEAGPLPYSDICAQLRLLTAVLGSESGGEGPYAQEGVSRLPLAGLYDRRGTDPRTREAMYRLCEYT